MYNIFEKNTILLEASLPKQLCRSIKFVCWRHQRHQQILSVQFKYVNIKSLVLNFSIPICNYSSSCSNFVHIDDKRISILISKGCLCLNVTTHVQKGSLNLKNKVSGNWPCNYSRSYIFNHYNTPMKKTFNLSLWPYKLLHIQMLQYNNKKIYKWLVHHHGATCY